MTKLRVICSTLLAAFLINFGFTPAAQTQESIFETIRREHEEMLRDSHHRGRRPGQSPGQSLGQSSEQGPARLLSEPNQPIDVTHYRLRIKLGFDNPKMISGSVTISATALSALSRVTVNANNNLSVTALRVDGQPRDFDRSRADHLDVSFPETLPAGRTFTVEVDYHGPPIFSGSFGVGMMVSTHGDAKTPVMATLSEPYGAPTWWPCIDTPTDKATAEIEATVPQGYVAASNGSLQKTEANPDGTETYFWREDYPIATYLISISATNYARFDDTYTARDGVTQMPLVYYVYPEHLERAREKFPVTRVAMSIFAELFGEYPFLGEKYGMAEFPWGGAMEHQTMSSMGDRHVSSASASHSIIVHELAHQWWGDLVTMSSWNDIWLNEGFATYSEVLFFERFFNVPPGEVMAQGYDDGEVSGRMGGTVYAEDESDPFDDTGAIYTKGAWVLHMLRRILGDEAFFEALKDYGRRYSFGNASTRDFQQVCEEHYGQSLDWFFQQWLFAHSRPIYKVTSSIGPRSSSGDYRIKLTVKQTQTHSIPGRGQEPANFYFMPLDVQIHYADGSSETRVVFNNTRKQKFSFTVPKQPVRIGFDEQNWVLKKIKG